MAVIAASGDVFDGPVHEVLTVGSSPNDEVTHDAKGNITFLPTNLLTPARALFWDFDNQLTGVDTTGDSTPDVTYQYDVLHRRVARVQGSADAVYVHAGNQVIAEYRLGGLASAPQQRYVWGDYIDEPILKQSSGVGASTLYYHHNQQYSTVALTNASGEVVERYAYTAYGELLITDHTGTPRASTAHGNRYLYTGREWDDATKLYHFRARWYEPVLGRFTGRDLSGNVDGENLYRCYFVLALYDPSGMWACRCTCPMSALPPSPDPQFLYFHLPNVGTYNQARLDCFELCSQRPIPCDWDIVDRAYLFEIGCTKESFLEWCAQEKKYLDETQWTKDLPACPCHLRHRCETIWARGGVPVERKTCENPAPNLFRWGGNPWLADYHPRAVYELRSRTTGDRGQQCTYGANCRLLDQIPDAGSADWVSPGTFGSSGHDLHDVGPWNCANELDALHGGDTYIQKYHEVRPVNGGKDCVNY
jgi:RHS repeat-associated protein